MELTEINVKLLKGIMDDALEVLEIAAGFKRHIDEMVEFLHHVITYHPLETDLIGQNARELLIFLSPSTTQPDTADVYPQNLEG